MTQRKNDYPYDDYGFELYEENAFPIAYLLTFTTYGSWLHGDERGSHQRSRDKRFGTIERDVNVPLVERMRGSLSQTPLILTHAQRQCIHSAIEEVCDYRKYLLRALNVRTNHGHVVVSASVQPEKIVNEFKSYATRRMRECGLITAGGKVWTRGASTRYLWKPIHVEGAIDYVLYSQGDDLVGTVKSLP